MDMLIGERGVQAKSGAVLEVTNPATNELIDTIPLAGKEDIEQALANSKKGLREWRAVPLVEKEQIFRRFYDLLEENKRDIIETLLRESGSSIRNGLFQFKGVGEVFRGYLETAKRHDGKLLVPGTEDGHDGNTAGDLQMVLYEPVGTVLAIVPFNAPLMLFSYKVAPALAAGNAVIVKPPTSNPLALIKVAVLLRKAGVPGNALQVVTGTGSLVGKHLVNDPRIDAITLTGSTGVGVEIACSMAKRLAPCSLELGGNDPFIVLDDVEDVREAARLAAFWRMNSAGQVCIAPKRFIVHNAVREAFTNEALRFVDDIEMGYDRDIVAEVNAYLSTPFSDFKPGKMVMNCLISEKAAREVEDQVRQTLAQGAKLLRGGKRRGAFYQPTVLGDVTAAMDIAGDMEVFGPVMPIIGVDSAEEAIEVANHCCYGLSGCVMTRDWKKGMWVAQQVEAGQMVINGPTMYRNMMQPFGGHKMSGLGSPEGFVTLGDMVKEKVVILKNFLSR